MRRSASPARLSLISMMSNGAHAGAAAGIGRALAIALGKLALGTLLQAADGRDHDAHGVTMAADRQPARRAASSHGLPLRPAPVAPHLLEIVEGAHLGPENVDDDVAGVDEHPVAMRHAFDARVGHAGLVRGLRARDPRSSRHGGCDLPEVTTMVSAMVDLPAKIDGDGVLGLHVVEACEDQAKDLLGGRTQPWRPVRRRCGRQPEQIAGVGRGPFLSLHQPPAKQGNSKIGTAPAIVSTGRVCKLADCVAVRTHFVNCLSTFSIGCLDIRTPARARARPSTTAAI